VIKNNVLILHTSAKTDSSPPNLTYSFVIMDTIVTNSGLTQNGYPCQWEGRADFKPSRIEFIRAVIRLSIAPAKSYMVGSYGGKHYIEQLTGAYISNGEFIVAMLMEGYAQSKVVPGRPNVSFKAKYLADHMIVSNLSHPINHAPDAILAHQWGKTKLTKYREIEAQVKELVDSTKQGKERVEDVIGH